MLWIPESLTAELEVSLNGFAPAQDKYMHKDIMHDGCLDISSAIPRMLRAKVTSISKTCSSCLDRLRLSRRC